MASHHHHHAIEPGSDAERLESQAGVDEDQGSGPSTDDVSKNLQESLLKALEGIDHKTHTAPPFAVVSPIGGSRPLGHPGIHVGGVGDIQLPLTVNQARQIIAKAQRARHVNLKGSKSLVNTSLRNTWELDPDLFELKNPYWEQRICNLARDVVEELGIDDITIRAELYKMVIYEKGAMFKAHTETKNVPGMFATMVISLPSAYEGGEVVLRHRGETMTFKTSSADTSVFCFYSDVSHQLLPVTSGYRWVLTYNLAVCPDAEPYSAASQSIDLCPWPLQHSLREWLLLQEAGNTPLKHLYFSLKNEYNEARMSLSGLKTVDYHRVYALQTMSLQLELDVFLAVLEKKTRGTCEHVVYDEFSYDFNATRRRNYSSDEDDDESQSGKDDAELHEIQDADGISYRIKHLADLEGRRILSDVSTAENFDSNLLQDFGLFDGVHGKEVYKNCKEHSEPYVTHCYRKTVAVIVPRGRLVQYMTSLMKGLTSRKGQAERSRLIEFFADRCYDPNLRTSAFASMQDLCQGGGLLGTPESSGPSETRPPRLLPEGEALRKAMKVALHLGKFDFFEKLATKASQAVPTSIFYTVKQHIDGGRLSFAQVEDCLFAVLAAHPRIDDRYRAIKALAPDIDKISSTMSEFIRRVVSEAARSCSIESKGPEDALALAKMTRYIDPETFQEFFIPLVEQKIQTQEAPFAAAALVMLQVLIENGYFVGREGKLDDIFKKPAENFISGMNAFTFLSRASVTKPAKVARLSSDGEPDRTDEIGQGRAWAMSRSVLNEFVAILIEKGYQELADRFFDQLVSQMDLIPAIEFSEFWLPFLNSLLAVLKSNDIPPTTEKYCKVFTSMLSTYLRRFVGEKPVISTSGVRPEVGCACNDCGSLNLFLTSPSQETQRFQVGKQRRQHLCRELDRADLDVMHTTELGGRCPSLCVTKINLVALSAWHQRRFCAQLKLAEINQDDLESVLGPEIYALVKLAQPFDPHAPPSEVRRSGSEEVPEFTWSGGVWADPGGTRRSGSRNLQRATQPSSGLPGSTARSPYRPGQVAGVKRPAPGPESMIDLTGDSD